MARNDRIFYAVQSVAIVPEGNAITVDAIARGVQSVGLNANFTLDQVFETGNLDIYATTGGRYNYLELAGGEKQDKFLTANAGIKIKINDRKVLKYTIAKAQADINAIEYTIENRRRFIQSDIFQLKDALTKKKEQLINTASSLSSWEKTYAIKKELFINGQETIDNLIQAFRELVSTNETFLKLENNYLDLIRDLDYVCGEYFTVINVQS